MIRAIMFDLDGTLLDIDLDGFLRDYFSALGPVISAIAGTEAVGAGIDAIVASTERMCRPHAGRTNREVFNESFTELTGADLDEPASAAAIDAFYAETFPSLQRAHGPKDGAGRAVQAALEAGLAVGLATNPIFPRAAIDERMRWAELDQSTFSVVTSYENMHSCKPHSEYFLETADLLGVEATQCLMVGDDPVLDMSAARAGVRTFYVGADDSVTADWRGSLGDLALLIERLDR